MHQMSGIRARCIRPAAQAKVDGSSIPGGRQRPIEFGPRLQIIRGSERMLEHLGSRGRGAKLSCTWFQKGRAKRHVLCPAYGPIACGEILNGLADFDGTVLERDNASERKLGLRKLR